MADDSKPLLNKLRALQTKLAELQAQEQAIVEEMGTLLAGGPGIGVLLKRLEQHYSDCWRVRYQSPYAFQHTKDVPQLKRLIKAIGVEELERRMLRYCQNGDSYFIKARHPFGLFVTSINQHASVGSAAGELELDLQEEATQTSRMLQTMRSAGVK